MYDLQKLHFIEFILLFSKSIIHLQKRASLNLNIGVYTQKPYIYLQKIGVCLDYPNLFLFPLFLM